MHGFFIPAAFFLTSHTQSFMLWHWRDLIYLLFVGKIDDRFPFLNKYLCVFVLQRMCGTSSARPQCTTTFPSTGTVSSSVCTSGTTARNTSATSSSPSSCRCAEVTLTLICFFALSFTWLYLHSASWCHVFLGAAVGACTPGVCPEGQREEWRHLRHGLQWHYGHHQTPHAHTFCGGEPCLSECLCVRTESLLKVVWIICHYGHREYSVLTDRKMSVIFREPPLWLFQINFHSWKLTHFSFY